MALHQQADSPATKEQVEAVVRAYWDTANVTSVTATQEFEFLDGFLWTVEIRDANDKPKWNYCYSIGPQIKRYDTLDRLMESIGYNRTLKKLMYSIMESGGISGLLAILIVLTLCIMALIGHNSEEGKVITALTLALGSVMGFFFGKKSHSSENDQ